MTPIAITIATSIQRARVLFQRRLEVSLDIVVLSVEVRSPGRRSALLITAQ
jgi:hypothetical protein